VDRIPGDPAGAFYLVNERVTLTVPVLPTDTVTENYGILDAGVGVVFSQRVTARVSGSLPVGVDDASSIITLNFGVNF